MIVSVVSPLFELTSRLAVTDVVVSKLTACSAAFEVTLLPAASDDVTFASIVLSAARSAVATFTE